MTDFPDLKMKAVVQFPAKVLDGTGIDIVKSNGSYQFNLAFDDFAPPIAASGDLTHKNALLWDDITGAYMLVSADTLSGAGSFLQAGTGAVTRTMQNKARERISTPDFGTATQAVTAVTTATSGGTIVVPSGAAATLPASYPNVAFDYYGPATVNLYSETGPSDSTASRLFRGQLPASTTGPQGVLAVESRPLGGYANGPALGSYALNISTIKQNWATTTQSGEIGGITVTVRNGGINGAPSASTTSDSSGLLCNVGSMGASGFACGVEGVTNNFNASAVILKGVGYQIGVVDAFTGFSYGFTCTAKTGVINYGMLIQAEGSASVTTAILYRDNASATKFSVDGSGNTVINATTASTTTGTGALIIAGGAGIAGDITWGGAAWTTYTPTIAVAGGGAGTATGRYKRLGKTICIEVTAAITTGGTTCTLTLPSGVTPTNIFFMTGRESATSGLLWQWITATSSNIATLVRYDNTFAVVNGNSFAFSGTFEAN